MILNPDQTGYFLSRFTRIKIADKRQKFELFILVYNTGENGSNKKESGSDEF